MQTALGTAGGFLLGGAIREVTRDIGGLVKGALDFQAQMANVNSIAQLGTNQLNRLSDQVNALAGETAQAPQVLAAGLYDIYSSGFQGAAALKVLAAAANAATAGLTTTDVAAKAITAVMNSYGQGVYTAQQVSDLLFQTVNDGVLTFSELSDNLGKTLSVASVLGVSLDQLTAAYAQLTLHGVNAAAAETDIADLMNAALNPTDALTQATIDYGYANVQALVAAKGIPGLLAAITQEANGSTDAIGNMLPNQQAQTAFFDLGGKNAAAYTAEIAKMNTQLVEGGATQKALAKQQQSAEFAIRQAKVAVQEMVTVLVGALAPGISLVARGFSLLITRGLLPVSVAFEHFTRLFGRAFAEGPKVDTLLKHLPDSLRGVGRAVLGAADFLGRFTRGLADVFRSGLGVDHFLRGMPQPLQQLARGFLVVADAVGDLVARWQSKGFAAMLRTVPRELDQIVGGLGEVARGAASAFVDVVVGGAITLAGDIADAAGNLLGWVEDRIAGGDWATLALAIAPITLLPLEIYGAIKLGGDLLDAQGHIWTWVAKKLYGAGAGGDPSLVGLPVEDPARENLTVGTLLVDGTLKLGDALQAAAGDLMGWVRRQLLGITGPGGGAPGGPQLPGDVAAAMNAEIPLGTLTVNAGLKLADDILGGADSLWDWLKGQLGATGASPIAGIPIAGGLGAALISVGDILIDGALRLGGTLAQYAGDLWGWLQGQLGVGGGSSVAGTPTGALASLGSGDMRAPLDLGDVLVTGAIKLSGDLSDVAGSIDKLLKLQRSAAQLAAAQQSGFDTGVAFSAAVSTGVANGISSGKGESDKQGGVWAGIKKILVWEPPFARDDQSTVIDQASQWAQGFGGGIHDAIMGGIRGALLGTSSAPGAAGSLAGLSAGDITQSGGLYGDIKSLLTFDLTGIVAPHLPGWVTATDDWLGRPMDYLINLIDGLAGHLRDSIEKLLGLKGQADSLAGHATSYGSLGYGGNAPSGPQLPSGGGTSGPSTNNASPNAIPVSLAAPKLPAPDTSAFDKVMAGISQQLADYSTKTTATKLAGDASLFDRSIAMAQLTGLGFANSVYAAKLDGDSSGFDQAIAMAELAGLGFAGEVFTARLTLDASAATSAAQSAASFINSLLPHSPAERGPLSRLPNWDALFEGIGPASRRGADIAEFHAARMAHLFGGSYALQQLGQIGGSGRGGGETHIHLGGVTVSPHFHGAVYQPDQIRDEMQNVATDTIVPAIWRAIERQQRANGGAS